MDAGEMDAGMALDRLIVDRVMGWFTVDDGWEQQDGHVRRQFCPSMDIEDAWEVVEKLAAAAGYPIRFGLDLVQGSHAVSAHWRARFGGAPHEGRADTAPLAICRAALAAVGAQ